MLIDERIELFSILFRLAGSPEYSGASVASYTRAIDSYFQQFQEHPAVEYARWLRESRGIGYSTVMSLAVHVTKPPELLARIPLSDSEELDRRWNAKEAEIFLQRARNFAREADFRNFVQTHSELYGLATERMNEVVQSSVDHSWFNTFFGSAPDVRLIIVPGLVLGGNNYGPKYSSPDGADEAYAIIGTELTDVDERPVFDEHVVSTIVHEFSHSFIGPTLPLYEEQLRASGETVFQAVVERMRDQAYRSWQATVEEALVRTAVARYLLAKSGPEAAAAEISKQQVQGFVWIDELFAVFGVYERNRTSYPSFERFVPIVVSYFSDLAPRIETKVAQTEMRMKAQRPRVISMSPPNFSESVDPDVTEIAFEFDRPMLVDSYSVDLVGEDGRRRAPSVKSVSFDESGRIFKMAVQLHAGSTYEFVLTGSANGGFRSRSGVPIEAYYIFFETSPDAK